MTLLRRRRDGRVLKLMSASGSVPIAWPAPPYARFLDDYVALLRAAGVVLPAGLTLTTCQQRPAVHHQWVAGTALPDLAAADPDGFIPQVQHVAAWARALESTPARLDTNLANFLLTPDGKLTCIDVLPPLLVPLRPTPRDAWQTLFGALCYDADILLCALSGYAARTLLAHHGPRPGAAKGLALCPGHRDSAHVAVRWFHPKGRAALAALDGELAPPAVLQVFAATSMLRLRNTPAEGRDALISAGLAALADLGGQP